MKNVQFVSLTVVALTICAVLRADIVTLTNNKVLVGKATDGGETVTIEMPQGTVKVPKSKVKSIVQKDTPQDEYNRRSAEIVRNEKDGELDTAAAANAWFQLADWAGQNGLPLARNEALRRTLELNPDHAGARNASGFVWFHGKWMTHAERFHALGMVYVDGPWLTPEAASACDRQNRCLIAEDQEQAGANASFDSPPQIDIATPLPPPPVIVYVPYPVYPPHCHPPVVHRPMPKPRPRPVWPRRG